MSEPLHITDDLLISYLLNEVSADEVLQVTAWRKLDMANERRFENFRLIWESSKNFKADKNIDACASLQKVKQRAVEVRQQRDVVVPLRNEYSWLKIAAAIFFIAGCAWISFNRFANPQVQFETQAVVKIDTLPDGSVVTLNKYARLDHPGKFSGNQRLVSLVKGEAFFNVTHNKAKPFIITAGVATIKVVGTSFNVKNKNDMVEIIVETGQVEVTNSLNKLMITLKPGEVALFNSNTRKFIKRHNQDNLYQYYRGKNLVYKNIPLSRLVAVLNEAYGANIVIERKELNNMLMAGNLKIDDNLDEIVEVIRITLKITVEKKQDKISLK
jgi:transmembrane sensor